MSTSGPLVAGVDLGGTNCAAALVDEDGEVSARVKVATPTDGPDAVVEAIVGLIGALNADVAAVGVGAPGPCSDGVVLSAPNLAGWTEPVDLGARLGEALGVPVAVDNDATVGAVGEWAAGAGRGADFLLGAWLGTGVGGGLVLDGRPYRGARGAAGELGHVCVQREGALCGCGRRGCVEAYAGRASMERAVAVALEAGRESILPELAAAKGKDRITSGVWAKALKREDALAVEIVDVAIAALGAGIGSVVNLLDLDVVVIGGGLAEKLGDELADRIADAAAAHVMNGWIPDIRVAALGDNAGIIGAATVARELG